MDKKISALDLVTTLDTGDVLPIVNDGTTKKVTVSQLIDGLATTVYVDSQTTNKVDKITGKGLSTEDYTTTEKSKLAGIASGAEVNVNADWNATTGDALILNKPTISNVTNLSYLASSTNGIVVSDTGTDATVPLADATNAGLLKPSKFTVLENTSGTNSGDNATNTTSNSYADGKVTQTITNGVTTTAPSEDAVFDALALKANDSSVMHLAGTETITGVKTFGTNLKTTVPFNSIPTIAGIASDGTLEALYTGTYPNQTEISYVKGVTSGIQTQLNNKQPLASVLTNTTAAFTTAQETKLSGIATGATANSSDATLLARANHTGTQTASTISDFNSASRAQTEAELVAGTNITITPSGTGATRQLIIASTGGGGSSSQSAYTVLANNTNTSAVPTEQVFRSEPSKAYAGATPTWTGTTAPSGTTNHTYSFNRIGNLVTLRISLDYSVAGATLTAVTFDLPSDCPTPELPSGVSTAGDVINYGSGMLASNRNIPATPTATYSALRIKSTGVYEINIGRATGAAHKYAYATIQYFTT